MADAPELTIRMVQVERGLDRETTKREEGTKYMKHMVEDVQARYQEIALSFARLEAAFTEHAKDDKQMVESMGDLDKRMRLIERLTWVAIGGVTVIAALTTFYGTYLVKLMTP